MPYYYLEHLRYAVPRPEITLGAFPQHMDVYQCTYLNNYGLVITAFDYSFLWHQT